MAQLIYTLEKNNTNAPWIISQPPYAEDVCTVQELNDIILPYRNYIRQFTGFQSVSTEEISNVQLTITYTFDSTENANAAIELIKNADDVISKNRQDLMRRKRENHNSRYTETHTVIE